MTKTFDTSRVGGGTYELALGADGNYKLNSVGFDQVKYRNLSGGIVAIHSAWRI